MKNFILIYCFVLMMTGTAHALVRDVKCQAQVDQEIKKLNLGTYDKPNRCGEKIKVGRVGDVPGVKFRFSIENNGMPEVYYTEKSDMNDSGGPYVRIANHDLYGNFIIKDVHYDENCNVSKVYFRENTAGGSQNELTLDKNTCSKFRMQSGLSKAMGLQAEKSSTAKAVCKTYGFYPEVQDTNSKMKETVKDATIGN